MSEEFYSHRTTIRKPPDQLVIDMARSASAYKVLAESLQAGDQSLVLNFPEVKETDQGWEVLVYGAGTQ
jgi:hypothetical protein